MWKRIAKARQFFCWFPGGPVEIQVMNCPSTTIIITPTTEMDQLGVFWSPPFAISSTGMIAPIVSQTHEPGDLFPIPSTTTVTYAFAFGGVSAACRFDVRVGEWSTFGSAQGWGGAVCNPTNNCILLTLTVAVYLDLKTTVYIVVLQFHCMCSYLHTRRTW